MKNRAQEREILSRNIRQIILNKLGIDAVVNCNSSNLFIRVQTINSLINFMRELFAYEYTIFVHKQKDKLQDYVVAISIKDLQTKLDIWDKQDKELKPL